MLKREQVEHARLRALAQGIVNKEKAVEAFEEYRHAAFPWIETQRRRDAQDHIEILAREVKRGALAVRPLWEKPIRSRLKTKMVERSTKAKEEIYDKLSGSKVPKQR